MNGLPIDSALLQSSPGCRRRMGRWFYKVDFTMQWAPGTFAGDARVRSPKRQESPLSTTQLGVQEVQETLPISQLASNGRHQQDITLIRSTRKEIATLPCSCKGIATSPRCPKEITTSPLCPSVNERELQRGRPCGGNACSSTLLQLVRRSASQKARRDGNL
ncbi:hypothetical protein DFH08DRAFT_804229 [Mycena albidolilacea]|uniref:Uncharacterized protein n=1 Tax=Mycena albidolilacea TaxID=1033008 RepID=A0AAD7AC38_9AGAR|nr:hypothetical protein DFH08DRAFT_804229 [Mycena albidolilacea]